MGILKIPMRIGLPIKLDMLVLQFTVMLAIKHVLCCTQCMFIFMSLIFHLFE
jgi:hypothetical protein